MQDEVSREGDLTKSPDFGGVRVRYVNLFLTFVLVSLLSITFYFFFAD